jgi:hypothetical protein
MYAWSVVSIRGTGRIQMERILVKAPAQAQEPAFGGVGRIVELAIAQAAEVVAQADPGAVGQFDADGYAHTVELLLYAPNRLAPMSH